MEYTIHCSTLPSLDISLSQGESVYTESGGMAWMIGDIEMQTNAKGGLLRGLARTLSGESFFLTTYTAQEDAAVITFTPEAPGSIIPVELGKGESCICQKRCLYGRPRKH